MEDNPYLVDMCLVVGLIMMLILMHLRGLYIEALLVYLYIETYRILYYYSDHTLVYSVLVF